MSKIKQPLFSDWPPIKLKSKTLFIPKNPSVPNKHELFKIPRSVTNLWKNQRYDPLSYKTKIEQYNKDIDNILFPKEVTLSDKPPIIPITGMGLRLRYDPQSSASQGSPPPQPSMPPNTPSPLT